MTSYNYLKSFTIPLIIVLSLSFGFLSSPFTTYAQTGTQYRVYLPLLLKRYPPYEPAKGTILSYPNCEDMTKLGVGWYQNNGVLPTTGCPTSDRRFVPRIYDANAAADITLLNTAINNAQASGWLIGFTEPNLPWHGNITPQQGAIAWRAIENVALPASIQLVSPSTSQHDPGSFDPYGYTWLWAMVQAYQSLYGQKPHFDAIAWNYYTVNPKDAQFFLTSRRAEADIHGYQNVPFWILEYAGTCWDKGAGNTKIMTEITPWFNNTPWITRYSWFTHRINPSDAWAIGWESCSLINPNTGALTALGSLYAQY